MEKTDYWKILRNMDTKDEESDAQNPPCWSLTLKHTPATKMVFNQLLEKFRRRKTSPANLLRHSISPARNNCSDFLFPSCLYNCIEFYCIEDNNKIWIFILFFCQSLEKQKGSQRKAVLSEEKRGEIGYKLEAGNIVDISGHGHHTSVPQGISSSRRAARCLRVCPSPLSAMDRLWRMCSTFHGRITRVHVYTKFSWLNFLEGIAVNIGFVTVNDRTGCRWWLE